MGKSQAALEYAYRMRGTGRYQVTGWVRADSAVTALGSGRDWLVMFDNAREPGDLAGMLPGGGGHVLITSRNRAWTGIAVQLDLEVFSRAESVAFLCRRSGRPSLRLRGSWLRNWGIFRWRWPRLPPISMRGR